MLRLAVILRAYENQGGDAFSPGNRQQALFHSPVEDVVTELYEVQRQLLQYFLQFVVVTAMRGGNADVAYPALGFPVDRI